MTFSQPFSQGDVNTRKKLLHKQGYVLKHEAGDILANSICILSFLHPWYLAFCVRQSQSLLGLTFGGSQGLFPLACGKVSHHHTLAGSMGVWLSGDWPPKCLEVVGVGVQVFRSDWERQACCGQIGRGHRYCTLKRDGEDIE